MITFGANFSVNNNIYDKLSSDEARKSVEGTVSAYEKFINSPKIKALTEDDTIELRKGISRGNYSLELEITNPKFDKPYITGVYTNKKEPNISHKNLIYQTILYICFKSGEKPRFLESSFSFIKRVFFNDILKKTGKEE